MQPLRVAVIEVNDLSRHGLQALLEKLSTNVQFVGAFATLHEMQAALHDYEVDVLLLDDMLPGAIALQKVVSQLRGQYPRLSIVILSNKLNFSVIHTLVRSGVSGYIYREERLQFVLPQALDMVRRGDLYLSPQVSALPYTEAYTRANHNLTPRDVSVLHLMVAGKNVQQMAAALDVTDRVIYGCQSKLRSALGVPTNELIVAEAIKAGWLKDIDS